MRCLAASFLFALASTSALGDSSTMFEFPDGQTVALTSNGNISMAAESVSIVPSNELFERGYSIKLPMMEVRCMFQLVNNTDEERNITVGFPIDDRFGDDYRIINPKDEMSLMWENGAASADSTYMAIPPNLDFKTFVNGEEIPVYYRSCAGPGIEELGRAPIAAVWKMKFQAGESVTLVNTYNTSWDYFSYDAVETYSVNYILTTGATWDGPIGDVVVTLRIPAEFPNPTVSDTLYSFWDWTGSPVIDGRTVIWQFTDLEPTENLEFSIKCDFVRGHISHCDGINAKSMYGLITWTEEALLESATPLIENAIGFTPTAELCLPIIEAIPYVFNGHLPPDEGVIYFFRTPDLDHPRELSSGCMQRLEVVEGVKNELEENISLAEDAGYLEFLPVFCTDHPWDEGILTRYAAHPEQERRFLDLLELHETAMAGGRIEDPAIEAFYWLTGWYFTGIPAGGEFLPAEAVLQYLEY